MLNKLILGTVQLGLDYGINNKSGKPTKQKAFEILHTAYDNGIRFLDTAEAYGQSQNVIGEFQKLNPEKKFNIITKLDSKKQLKENELLAVLKTNCETLHSSKLYCYMFHNYQSLVSNKLLYTEFESALATGLVEKIGISLHSNIELMDVIENYKSFKVIQIPFNLFDNELKRKEVILKAREAGVEIHTRSAFLQGLFFLNKDKMPSQLQELRSNLDHLDSIKKQYNIDTATMALKYVIEKKYIDKVLIGVESSNQLLENLKNCNSKLTIPHQIIDCIDINNENLLNPAKW